MPRTENEQLATYVPHEIAAELRARAGDADRTLAAELRHRLRESLRTDNAAPSQSGAVGNLAEGGGERGTG